MILPLPNREQFETELRDKILERSDQKDMAAYLRISPARISRQLDPYNKNAVSPSFQILEWLWSIDAKDPGKGDRMLEQIIRERQKWLVNRREAQANDGELTAEVVDAAADLVRAEAQKADTDTLLNKTQKLLAAAENKSNHLKHKKSETSGFVN